MLNRYGLYFAWIVALVATGGSLYFSEVVGFVPCKLCWVQRILMYPQVILLGIASYRSDRNVIHYALPFTFPGIFIALYHYLEQKVPALRVDAVCAGGVPCSGEYINWLGFVTIPFLSLTAFILITFFLLNARSKRESDQSQ